MADSSNKDKRGQYEPYRGRGGTRLYCPYYAGREVTVRDGLVAFTDSGLVIGVIERPPGNPLPEPEPLSESQREVLDELRAIVEVTAGEARLVPLRQENRRRREAFVERVREAISMARGRHRRWPTVRETQQALRDGGQPAGRKEKIAEQIRLMKNEEQANEGEDS